MLVRIVVLTSALFSATASAGGQFTYYQVASDGLSKTLAPGEVDLSYPPPGVPTPIIDLSKGERNEGVPISGAAQRGQRQPHIVISLQQQLDTPVMSTASSGKAMASAYNQKRPGDPRDPNHFAVSEQKYRGADQRAFIQSILARMPPGSSAQRYAASVAAGER
jgi:hypothetical protein